ncbi:MAG TPA: T9SS type A sorting domain-containing protein [Puia sp.]|nr:T9SS type A sorting domain-containing protein [Puia sp.]
MNPQARTTLTVLVTTLLSLSVYSQTTCSSPTIAPAACSGGNGAATNGVNINGGNTYWFSAGPSTFSSLNLSGGTLRICGNLTVTSMNINSGTIIIEQGGIFSISGSFNVGNLTIINRGTLNINGSLTLQGTASTIYNDLSTSYLSITGNLVVNNASGIINRGIFAINGSLTLQGSGNNLCLQDNAIFNVGTFTNDVTNSITYAGNGASACFSVSGSATLNNALTASNKISVCKSSSAPSTGWGAAIVTNGCTSCATILALTINDLTAARRGDNIMLQWTTRGAIHEGDIFYVERSMDGSNFEVLASVTARDDQSIYTATDNTLAAPKQYYRIRTVTSAGNKVYSIIALANTGLTEEQPFSVYPNPINPNGKLYIRLTDVSAGRTTGITTGAMAHLSLLDATGRTVGMQDNALSQGDNVLSWRLPNLHPGVYFLRVVYPGGNPRYSPVTIL